MSRQNRKTERSSTGRNQLRRTSQEVKKRANNAGTRAMAIQPTVKKKIGQIVSEYPPRSPRESDRPEYAGTNIAFLEDIPAEPTNASSRPFDPAIEPFSGKEDVVEFLNAFSAAGQERNASTRQVFECIRKKRYYTGNAALQIETWKIDSDSAHKHLFTSVSNPAVVLAN